MDIINFSPFPHLSFEWHTPDDTPFGVLVVKGTFRLQQGGPLRPVPDQEAVRLSDAYNGERGASSLRLEADIAPFKPCSDVHLCATAMAPNNRPTTSWTVSARLGQLKKSLAVKGPHEWELVAGRGWRASDPRPCVEVPITYERAFGGTVQLDGRQRRFEPNPVGTGWVPGVMSRSEAVPAPQIGPLKGAGQGADDRSHPHGFGPVSPHWQPRLAKAGTYDEAWHKERRPCLPDDFRWEFFNSAASGLVYPGYVTGGEVIELVQLLRDRPLLRTSVPHYGVYAVSEYRNNVTRAFGLNLDTVVFDLASGTAQDSRVYLVWRGLFPFNTAVRSLEIRLRDLTAERQEGDRVSREVPRGA